MLQQKVIFYKLYILYSGILYYLYLDLALYESACLSVSLSVCLFPNSSETANPSELRDDSPWDKEGFKLKKHLHLSNS